MGDLMIGIGVPILTATLIAFLMLVPRERKDEIVSMGFDENGPYARLKDGTKRRL